LDSEDLPPTIYQATTAILEGEREARRQPEDSRSTHFEIQDRVPRTGELRRAELDLLKKSINSLDTFAKILLENNEKTEKFRNDIMRFLSRDD